MRAAMSEYKKREGIPQYIRNEDGSEVRKLLPYLKAYRKECVLAPFFKMLEACFDLLVPLVVAAVIDTGIANNDTGYIIRMCGILIVLALVGLLCSITAQFFAAKAAVGFSARLRSALFAHIQSLSFTEMDAQGTSTLITRMTSDINQMQNGLNLFLRLFLRSPFVVFGAMIMAFTIDWKAALVFVVTIPLLSLVVFGIMAWTMPRYKKAQGRLDGVLQITRENLTGVRVIRAFNKQEDEKRRFTGENAALTRLQLLVGRVSGLLNPLTCILINGAIIALVYVGAIRVDVGLLKQGQVIALVNYMSQILIELVKLANLIVSVAKALACAGRVQSVMETKNSMEIAAQPADGGKTRGVSFRDVSLRYAGAGEESLSALTFSAERGQTIGVIGGTGSGKTSLVSLIPRFYDATAGTVLVDGQDVRDYDPAVLRRKIGIVPQKAVLFKGTIRENLKWGNEDADDDALWAALETAQAAEVVRGKAKGLDEPVEQGGRNFSGGQRQRLTIARALVRRPDILILDDSASALDFATDAALRKAIRSLPDAPTTFIVSQRASSIQYADLIIVLDEGRAVGIGRHEELLETCPVYHEIYWSQFKKPEEIGVSAKGGAVQ